MENKLIKFVQWLFVWRKMLLYSIALIKMEFLNLHFEIRITEILVTTVSQGTRISRTFKNVFIKTIYSLKIRKKKFGYLLKELLIGENCNCNNKYIIHSRRALRKQFQTRMNQFRNN
ncbi:uncharacterized protein [Rhodnius prolixus]|uniref:uncharacterized protein n=1 Tax=Rhodnius prolixus TaxID=13249 RepID=UPI003D18D9DA